MPKAYVVSVRGETIYFSQDEIEALNSLDVSRVWSVFQNLCKKKYPFPIRNTDNELKKNGIEHLKSVISRDSIEKLKREWENFFVPIIFERNSTNNILAKDNNSQEYSVRNYVINERSLAIVQEIIRNLFSEIIVQKLENYLESFFSISHIMFSETFPDPDPITSFRWHCDFGPVSQTHIMLYLDDAEITGGKTEFINYEDSKKIIETGQGFLPMADRQLSIKNMYSDANVISPNPKAGDILIFNATQVYHCGIHPTSRSRKILTIVLQSSLVPWKEALSHHNILAFPGGRSLIDENPFFPYYKEEEFDD
jgi:ectoine hydroxylase-related dioxygenase (phytanoyl-CoA dioxygenase family)